MQSPTPSLWSRLVTVGWPFFKSERRARAWAGLAIVLVLLLCINGVNVVNSFVNRNFFTALAEVQISRFYMFAAIWAAVFALASVIEALTVYVQQSLGLAWRQWLSERFLERYLAGRTYLRLTTMHEIDNPDERISNDVDTFTRTTLDLLVRLVNGILTLIAFSGVLWLITPWLFLAAVGYAILGSLGTILIGRRLVTLNNQQLQKEADFRYGLGRVREHAQAVAQMGSEPEQRGRLGEWLTRLVDNFRQIIRLNLNLGIFTTAYGYFPQIIPALVVAPLYFRGLVQFGAITQAAMAFTQVQGAFSLVITQFQSLTTYAAIVQRLGSLWEETAPGAAPAALVPRVAPTKAASVPTTKEAARRYGLVVRSPAAHRLAFDHLTLWSAEDRRLLIRDLSLEVPEGKRLAITGPSVLCKALLRAAAGLWEGGEGRVILPDPEDIIFVARHHGAALGRLRDILRQGLGRDIPDDRLLATLKAVCVDEAVARGGGLEGDKDWTAVLSPGELCALAFARLLLASPRFAFVEDPSEALKEPVAKHVYDALARSSMTYVTVGCPAALLSYHIMRLELYEDGSSRVAPIGSSTSHEPDAQARNTP
jgi:vitamin B12/bleomycin/antimicrobial peptide transport system ATP-binding/permease protein